VTTQQEAHLLRIKDEFARRVEAKYRAGVEEHHGYLGDSPIDVLLEHAIAEAIDQFCYLSALGEKLFGKKRANATQSRCAGKQSKLRQWPSGSPWI